MICHGRRGGGHGRLIKAGNNGDARFSNYNRIMYARISNKCVEFKYATLGSFGDEGVRGISV